MSSSVVVERFRVLARAEMWGALLMSHDGLASDELFAIPATRTASVHVEDSTARQRSPAE
ncbi:hypothetical protein AO501_32785 [Mycobacterium gordonae]|uniref:Uncharacterized protein n=1 Tax=Mycobacterium gordonae TaxID=1778 RepID=A0A0Q2UH90_MYCGO|nr:hypothetical protein AO501_32785 [Mycobacterium gordonae]